jgi:hypothetical protein
LAKFPRQKVANFPGSVTVTAPPIEHSYEKEIIVPILLYKLLLDTNRIPKFVSEAAALIQREERKLRLRDPDQFTLFAADESGYAGWRFYPGGRKFRVAKEPAIRDRGFFRAIREPDSPQSRKWQYRADSIMTWELRKDKSPLEQT